RTRAVAAANNTLIELYWSIGEYISQQIATDGWGEGTVEALAEYIQKRQPNARGYSARNLWRMMQFYETYRDLPKLSPLVTELSWTHNLLILSRCKREEEREFYLRVCLREKWGKSPGLGVRPSFKFNLKLGLTLRQEARERRIISKCETFHRNPAGNQPVRQSRASSRKRVLRGGGRPSPRSVDSAIKRCVIEPRNFLVVSLRLGQSRGPRQALATLGPTSVPGHTGVGGTLANDHRGFTGTWETLPSPSYLPAGEPG